MTDRLLDAAAIAKRLGVPKTWVLESARSGAMPCVRLGRYANCGVRSSRRSTRSGYLSVLRDHLEPYFGRMRLDEIEVSDVDSYVAHKRRKGLAAPTVNRHLNVLRRVFKLALRARRSTTNPVLLVKPLDEPDRRLRWRRLQPEEIGHAASEARARWRERSKDARRYSTGLLGSEPSASGSSSTTSSQATSMCVRSARWAPAATTWTRRPESSASSGIETDNRPSAGFTPMTPLPGTRFSRPEP